MKSGIPFKAVAVGSIPTLPTILYLTLFIIIGLFLRGTISMRITHKIKYPDIIWSTFCNTKDRVFITAAISSRDITKNMVRVKSSNLWSFAINVKDNKNRTGDLYVQFKGRNGGPGDVYVYYDVPMKVYQQFISGPSKGHNFWKYIRGKYTFAKLTGDKRTKQKGGVNSP